MFALGTRISTNGHSLLNFDQTAKKKNNTGRCELGKRKKMSREFYRFRKICSSKYCSSSNNFKTIQANKKENIE